MSLESETQESLFSTNAQPPSSSEPTIEAPHQLSLEELRERHRRLVAELETAEEDLAKDQDQRAEVRLRATVEKLRSAVAAAEDAVTDQEQADAANAAADAALAAAAEIRADADQGWHPDENPHGD